MEILKDNLMPTIIIRDNQAIIPSSMLNLENGDSLDIVSKKDNTFILKPKKRYYKKTDSFMAIVDQLKGHSSFSSTKEIDDFIRNERDSWD